MILAACGVLYYLFYIWSGYGIPCLFRTITGLSCPGCGITRMFVALFGGNVQEAFACNQLAFVLLPAAVLYAVRYTFIYIRDGRVQEPLILKAAEWLVVAAFIIFGVIRNIVL